MRRSKHLFMALTASALARCAASAWGGGDHDAESP